MYTVYNPCPFLSQVIVVFSILLQSITHAIANGGMGASDQHTHIHCTCVYTYMHHVHIKLTHNVYYVWSAKCVKNTYKCYICISPSDI